MVAIDESQSTETSVQLLREFERTGDSVPFEAFMRRHAAMVYATCLKVTRDPHDAEDATQATFLTLASKSRLNGEIRQPEAWLRKVAHRLSLDLIRSKKRRINRENLRSEMTSEEAPLDSSDHAGNGELKGILNEELAKLPASYRMPLILHYFGGLSREEMADQLKLKPSTLGVRLHRAREQLRKRLSNRGIALPAVALTALLTEVVRSSVCSHLMSRTAQQASAIAMGHATAPVFTAGPGVNTFRLVTELIGGSKLRVLLSSLVVGSAISMTSAQVRDFLPAFIKDLMPSFKAPSIPKLDFSIPTPRFVVNANTSSTDAFAVVPVGDFNQRSSLTVSNLPPQAVVVVSDSKDIFAGPINIQSAAAQAIPLAVSPIGSGTSAPRVSAPAYQFIAAAPVPIAKSTWPASNAPASAPTPVRNVETPQPVAISNSPGKPNRDAWNSVLPTESTSSSGPSVPLAQADSTIEDAPVEVAAAVTGSVPTLSSESSGGVAAGSASAAAHVNSTSTSQTPAKSAIASRTTTFAGTSANYGGYADSSWSQSQIVDLSGSLFSRAADEASFSAPSVPGEADTLSINGARITMRNASSEEPVTISFVDTSSTAIPALPEKHHFIGVWEMETTTSYEAIDLLVRYDDLRAARLGLNEQILKLWVSDGETWTLLWKDPTFGRDVYQNLLWVTADSDVKFFAVSAPEPASLTVLIAAGGLLAKRRRRDA